MATIQRRGSFWRVKIRRTALVHPAAERRRKGKRSSTYSSRRRMTESKRKEVSAEAGVEVLAVPAEI